MNFFTRFGNRILAPLVSTAGFGMRIAGETIYRIPQLPKRWVTFREQFYLSCVRTLHVVVFVAFFIGMIVALQVGLELARYGQQEAIGYGVSLMMVREMGPFVTAILMAASVGSAMAAELGTMKVQEEITALEVMSVDVISLLVLPRVLALTLAMPILTILANYVGTIGGGVIAVTQLNLDFGAYTTNALTSLRDIGDWIPLPISLFGGLLKSLIFGFVIGVIGCASGLSASRGAAGVGRTTRAAVRDSIILVIVLNFFLGKFLFQ
ncbi:MAG: ABC transporter permease [Planctomycetes bacterium]|jgi:phospholipid/cholesterol/gamma-HCH transport system permease protein|nr:ABC transporter permease [Planctomycetota bacterium]MBT4028234.1 ABC transporter permease [Planctomycetota bacterium]MBT4560973.1 ABC transporter permease [Planctomycetota bacterium]MBT5102181.1 ABC transporter permease [Planctomycetota bacterium]MBT5121035.1 ABC transporter permease [Planctomycetota bacterium]